MLMGFLMASIVNMGFIDWVLMIHANIGTYFIAAGTAAHNQFLERDLDGLMNRTKTRPLPTQRISAHEGKLFSVSLIIIGLGYLIWFTHPIAAAVSLSTTLIYLVLYTPMKQKTAFNIIIGAIPGGLPPVGGWAAVTGNINDPGMWILFAIVFFWQIPHVMAIAWVCKEDYSEAGFKMLPKGDHNGQKTSIYALFCIIILFAVNYSLYALGLAHTLFLISSISIGLFFLFFGLHFIQARSYKTARALMYASIAYLPLIWLALSIDILIN